MISGENKAPMNGLVLAGGRSTRMGEDKGLIKWHHKEQRYHVADLIAPFCEAVFISCRADQAASMDPGYRLIMDEEENAGPLGAILSAFHQDNTRAWLVLACDLPLIDHTTLQFLVSHRNPTAHATTFRSPHDGLPEPLITIWEPSALSLLEPAFADGKRCPRKVLLNNVITLLDAPQPLAMANANTPEDREKIRQVKAGPDII